MNHIYDIVLNFQPHYYQFFEWKKTDKINNIQKIIVYHITDQDLMSLTYNTVTINGQFLDKLKEDTKKQKNIICLVSNTTKTIGLLFSKEGKLLKRSSLLFEEEDEVNDFVKDMPITNITYQINEKQSPLNDLRIEIENKKNLIQFINQTNDIITLKYLYYEYFNKECNDTNNLKNTLTTALNSGWTNRKNKLYQTLNILTQKTS